MTSGRSPGDSSAAPSDPNSPGSALLEQVSAALGDHYDIERLVGAGGMGSVFLGRDRTLDRPVAIKVITPELAATMSLRERFLQEARTVARLRHPNVVAVYAAGESQGILYFVMEYVPGESLRERLARDQRWDDRAAIVALRDLARALAAAHAQGIVHRDVKPENVLLDSADGRAMLTDFGVARAFAGGGDGRLTGTGMVLGSPRYMSPEQASGEREIDGRSDVYSLGLVAYEMFAGEPAVTAKSGPQILMKQITETPPPIESRNPKIVPAVAYAVAKALAKEPGERFQTAGEMADALDAALTGEMPAGAAMRRPARRQFGRRTLVGAAAGVLALVALFGWLVGGRTDLPDGADPRRSFFVAPFDVQSSDPQLAWLREGSMSMLALNLAQWKDITVIDYERGLDLLRDAGHEEGRRIGLEDALDVARRGGAWTVVMGNVQGTADSILVSARLFAVENGKRLDEAHRSAPRAADPRQIFDALARDLLDLAGAPQGIALTSLSTTTTTSLEAYRLYLAGAAALNRWELARADSLLQRATQIDTTFALAYYRRALALGWLSVGDTSQQVAIRAAQRFASRLPERERGLVDAYVDLTTALRAETRQDSATADAAFRGAQAKYRAAITRDSTDAEAWYGLGDAYWHHRPDGFSGSASVANWNRALRAFNRTLALDSTFHLAYAHKLEIYRNAAQPQSFMVLDGDSVIAFQSREQRAAYGDARYAAAKQRAQAQVVREARAWANADAAAPAYFALSRAWASAGRFDSAAAVLSEGVQRLGPDAGSMPLLRALLLARVSDVQGAQAAREAIPAMAGGRRASEGGGERYMLLLASGAVAGMSGDVAAVEEAGRLAALQVPPNVPANREDMIRAARWWMEGVKVAMGAPLARARAFVDSGIARVDGGQGPGIEQARRQAWSVPYVLYLATRDPRYAATTRKWRVNNPTPFVELEALEAIRAGDTARARTLARQFPNADSTRAAGGSIMAVRWVARAEVLAELGDREGAIAMYEVLDPAKFAEEAPVDLAFPLYARSFLARGRLYESLGDAAKARASYERFIALWSNADPGVQRELREAQDALARVRDARQPRPLR